MRLELFATLLIIAFLCFLLQSTAFEQSDVEIKEAVPVVLDEMKNENGLNFRVRRAPKGGGGGRKGGGGGGGRKGGGGGGGKGGGRGGGGGGKGGGRRGGGGGKGGGRRGGGGKKG